MKTVITLHQITRMHFYLATPKSVQITPHDENKEQEKEAKRVEEKKTGVSCNFYIFYFGEKNGRAGCDFFNVVFINLEIHLFL